TADEASPWDVRHDSFSDYRAGFEIRTYRRCQRVLLFHQFEKELATDCEPVSELALLYDDQNEAFSFLTQITSTGYKRDKEGLLLSRSLPPMTYGYQAHAWNSDIKTIDPESLQHLPSGVDGQQYRWVDLYNEALSGVLTEQAGGLYYKQNLGRASFAEARLVSPAPSMRGLASGALQIQDLQSNGSKCLLSTTGPIKGFYKLDEQEEWQNFQPFSTMPNIDFQDPNLRVIDLNGDGMADVLISEDQVFRWYPSAGEAGFTEARKTAKAQDEDSGPAIVFANESESIFLTDMTGDGMADIVRIRNASIVYWPNLGYGNFGAKVSMAQAPQFNHPDLFNPSHIRLVDLDGSGTTDIVYLGQNEFRYWLNQSGNSWSTPYDTLYPFPDVDNQSTVSVMDLLGTGTACVVWSSPLAKHSADSIRYIDLMQSTKPHLMTNYQNGMGKEVTLSYTPSTQFYLQDKQKGEPWISKLHFPVHCLSKVESFDHISKARFASSYSYHHGFYDKSEREFRGFGRVDQIDSEDYEHSVKGESSNVDERVLQQTPMLSKTWFHTGFYLDKDHILSQYQAEYFNAEALQDIMLAEPELPADMNAAEWREALRACKGMALHSEVYGLDGSADEDKPYSISQTTCQIKSIQPKAENQYAVFQVINSESLSLQLDRHPEDPRISHNLVLQTDDYGNPLLSATVGYPRQIEDLTLPEEVRSAQGNTHIVISQAEYTDDQFGILGDFDLEGSHDATYRLPVTWKSSSYELSGLPDPAAPVFSREELDQAFQDAALVDYQDIDAEGQVKRPLQQSETRFINDALDGARTAGQSSPLGITWQSYQLAFTPALLQSIYGDKVDSTVIEGGYLDLNGDGNWWTTSGTPIFVTEAASRFYAPDGAR
ncbi:MAG: toxin TcdB middle/N-terminal domain-containing protein, partial [Xanthomonadales bacterium]|nr:toxin TcdB middle/N-terminal domain-containing protein [Xanthomonadales bacterium]